MSQLPTLEDMRRHAFALLGDAEDWLRSDWREGTGPTREQAQASRDTREAIQKAKNALDRAAG
ncbi:hypothetical protein [Arthrobacter sp. VKM Ac-2550]|uniref:hypothetical protein n=1 Tax=Crystallibacter permensis TaxID=1938888 RepID=UPI002227BF17|nr:hypothetical protein [Arthrobacter sp. VKM Ac-2550]MCW2133368.1 hypothetical protein [Arthrobacter sp. VKM Ac-2550]